MLSSDCFLSISHATVLTNPRGVRLRLGPHVGCLTGAGTGAGPVVLEAQTGRAAAGALLPGSAGLAARGGGPSVRRPCPVPSQFPELDFPTCWKHLTRKGREEGGELRFLPRERASRILCRAVRLVRELAVHGALLAVAPCSPESDLLTDAFIPATDSLMATDDGDDDVRECCSEFQGH